MIVKDVHTKEDWDIWDASKIEVTYVGFNIVDCRDKGNGNTFTLRIGDAIFAGIHIPKEETLFEYANKEDETQLGEFEVIDSQD